MGTLANLGYIKRALVFNCMTPDPIIVIEAAAKAGAITLMNAATFSCIDILKMRAGISPWHARGLRSLINGSIPGAQQDQAGKILKYTVPLEKALFFMFVVDLTTDFAANWQSQIFKLGECRLFSDDTNASGPVATWVEPTPNAWTPISYNFTSTGPPRVTGTQFSVPAGYSFSVQFSLSAKPIIAGQPVGSLTTRLLLLSAPDIALEADPATPDWFGNPIKQQIMYSSSKPAGHFQQWEFQAMADNPAVAIGGSAAVTVSSRPYHDGNLIPVNCFGLPAPSQQTPV